MTVNALVMNTDTHVKGSHISNQLGTITSDIELPRNMCSLMDQESLCKNGAISTTDLTSRSGYKQSKPLSLSDLTSALSCVLSSDHSNIPIASGDQAKQFMINNSVHCSVSPVQYENCSVPRTFEFGPVTSTSIRLIKGRVGLERRVKFSRFSNKKGTTWVAEKTLAPQNLKNIAEIEISNNIGLPLNGLEGETREIQKGENALGNLPESDVLVGYRSEVLKHFPNGLYKGIK